CPTTRYSKTGSHLAEPARSSVPVFDPRQHQNHVPSGIGHILRQASHLAGFPDQLQVERLTSHHGGGLGDEVSTATDSREPVSLKVVNVRFTRVRRRRPPEHG